MLCGGMLRPALLAVSVLVACGGETKKQQTIPEDVVVDMYTCTVTLVRKDPLQYAGEGSDADAAKATEAAWTEACGKLPEASRADCRDAAKFTANVTTTVGAGIHKTSVELTSMAAKLSARSLEPLDSREAACADARQRACERAGVTDDCVASGAYVETVDEVEAKKTVQSAPQ